MSLRDDAYKWWTALSINEQKYYTSLHPFYGKMDSIYVIEVSDGILRLYEWLLDQEIIH